MPAPQITTRPRRKPQLPPEWASMVRRMRHGEMQIVGLPADIEDPTFPDRRSAEAWIAARLDHLAARTRRGHRPCLCCGTTFLSEGLHNRLCDPCRGQA